MWGQHFWDGRTVAEQPQTDGVSLAILLEQAARLIYPERAPTDMHPGQWAALRYLARANVEAATVAGLARYLGVTLGPASRAVAALVRKGLITSEADPKDRRKNRLALTRAGKAVLGDDPIHDAGAIIARMPLAIQAALGEAMAHLLVNLGNGADTSEARSPFQLEPTE